jgi:hypothetical protein
MSQTAGEEHQQIQYRGQDVLKLWEGLSTVGVKITVFWNLAPCNVVDKYQPLGSLYLQDREVWRQQVPSTRR